MNRRYAVKLIILTGVLVMLAACGSHPPMKRETSYQATGKASYYANKFHGRKTASGEIYYKEKLTAAHRSLPFGTRLRVTNLSNGREVVVRVNDRGPYIKGRIIDVSYAAARKLGMTGQGVVRVRVVRVR